MRTKFKEKLTRMAATAAAVVFLKAGALPVPACAQELSMQITGSSLKNEKEYSLCLGFSSKKPLSGSIDVGFDLSLAISENPDIVESYQFWLAYRNSDSIIFTPYFWKDRFYGVDPYAAGIVVSVGKLNLIAEYEAPKTAADSKVWAEGISFRIDIGKFTFTPKLIFSQLGDKAVDILGGEIKLSYNAYAFEPFIKVKTMGLLENGACSTNVQGGLGILL